MRTVPQSPDRRVPRPLQYGPLLDALRGASWSARRSAAASLPGAHASRLRGSAPELSEYRPYRQGDDPRRIDWRLLARSDRAYIRLAEDRSVRTTLIVVDASASMAFPEETLAKWDRARELAVGLAAVAQSAGDPVGLVVPRVKGAVRVAPRTRRDVLAEIARTLDAIAPEGSAPLANVLGALPHHARIAVVSDFLGDAEQVRRRAGEIAAAGGEVHAVHVVAETELEPDRALALAVDPEDETIRRPLVAGAREEYVRRFAAWRASLAEEWAASGLTYTLVTCEESASRAVMRVTRAARGGGERG